MAKKKQQEELRGEKKKKRAIYDLKCIFVDTFDIQNFDEEIPIITQLVHIFDQVNYGNMESNEKLIDWFVKRSKNKVVDKVTIAFANLNL